MRNFFTNLIKYPLAAIFSLAILLMFVLYLVLPQTSFSQKENRSLQMRPSVSLSSIYDVSYMEQFETYTTEQIPFRDSLVNLKAFVNRLSGSIENNGIVRGQNGYLFAKSHDDGVQFKRNKQAISMFVQNANRPVTVAIAPNAYEILSDYVPYGFPKADQKTALESLYSELKQSDNCRVVNLYDALYSHRDEYIYYRTDHHWTSLGAYYGYCEMVDSPVDITMLQQHEVCDFYGTHAAKYRQDNILPDVLTYYDVPIVSYERSDGSYTNLYDLDKLEIYDKYAIFLRGNDSVATIHADLAGNGKRLIVFKDSYANCLIPFLLFHYDDITVVDLRYYADSVEELLNANPDSEIMLLYNFQFMTEDNHFYRLTSSK